MVSLPDGEKISKISLFVLAQVTNVTDGQTDGHRVTAYTAHMHMHRTVKNEIVALDRVRVRQNVFLVDKQTDSTESTRPTSPCEIN